MDDPARKDLIGHLFALVTAKLEDASALAGEGQAADETRIEDLVTDINRLVSDAHALTRAITIV